MSSLVSGRLGCFHLELPAPLLGSSLCSSGVGRAAPQAAAERLSVMAWRVKVNQEQGCWQRGLGASGLSVIPLMLKPRMMMQGWFLVGTYFNKGWNNYSLTWSFGEQLKKKKYCVSLAAKASVLFLVSFGFGFFCFSFFKVAYFCWNFFSVK